MGTLPVMKQGGLAGANELNVSRKSSEAMAEMQAHVYLAQMYPRDEEALTRKVIAAARDLGGANLGKKYEGVEYVYPRGGEKVRGPSVYFAKEAARIWKHVHFGIRILEETEEQVSCEAWAWDVENGTRPSAGFLVKKLQQRKDKHGNTSWVVPDVRDLRELINNVGARAVRNCILEILPYTLIARAVAAALEASIKNVKEDPKAALDDLVKGFAKLGITRKMLEEYLGHPARVEHVSAEEIAELMGIGRAIHGKQATWADYVRTANAPEEPEKESIDLHQVFSDAKAQESEKPAAGEKKLQFGKKPGPDYPD